MGKEEYVVVGIIVVLLVGAYLVKESTELYQDNIPSGNILKGNNNSIYLVIQYVRGSATESWFQLLNENNISATLFIVPDKVKNSERFLLVNAVKQGYTLGCQESSSSEYFTDPSSKLYDNIKRCDKTIDSIYEEAAVNRSAKLLMLHHYHVYPYMIDVFQLTGYTLVNSHITPHDWEHDSYGISVELANKTQKGDIIIFRDEVQTALILMKLKSWLQTHQSIFDTIDNIKPKFGTFSSKSSFEFMGINFGFITETTFIGTIYIVGSFLSLVSLVGTFIILMRNRKKIMGSIHDHTE